MGGGRRQEEMKGEETKREKGKTKKERMREEIQMTISHCQITHKTKSILEGGANSSDAY